MRCPFCHELETKVVDSRYAAGGEQTRRRRECLSCSERFTTYESIELNLPRVIKSDNTREAFNEVKLRNGMLKALEKRPVSSEDLETSIAKITANIVALGDREINSSKIGSMVMRQLYKLDEVAYIRFASVYRKFQSIAAFKDEIDRIKSLEEV